MRMYFIQDLFLVDREVNEWVKNDGGSSVSPIDLNMSRMRKISLPLMLWYNYEIPPKKAKLTNTGKTAILSGKWQRERPHLTSGPFLDGYTFSQIHFHWGPNEMVGSEHSVDGGRQPMELHAVHFKSEYLSQEVALRERDGIVVLVYMFKLQSMSNVALNPIVKALNSIRDPHSSTRITPEPIINILRPFSEDYFLYKGSLEIGSQSHEITWVISREPIGISLNQVGEFRNLTDTKFEKILDNCRPLEDGKNTKVFHVCPSGSSYATLLPIPRNPTPLTESQNKNL